MGIGSAIALGGQLYEGATFSAGEIFSYIDPEKLANNRSLEKTICLDSLMQMLRERIDSGMPSILSNIGAFTFQDVITAYRTKDALVLDTLREIGREIGCAVSNIANLLAIDTVILGGEYLAFLPISCFRRSGKLWIPHCTIPCAVCPSTLEHHAGIFGSFHLARTAYFDHLCNCRLASQF